MKGWIGDISVGFNWWASFERSLNLPHPLSTNS